MCNKRVQEVLSEQKLGNADVPSGPEGAAGSPTTGINAQPAVHALLSLSSVVVLSSVLLFVGLVAIPIAICVRRKNAKSQEQQKILKTEDAYEYIKAANEFYAAKVIAA